MTNGQFYQHLVNIEKERNSRAGFYAFIGCLVFFFVAAMVFGTIFGLIILAKMAFS